MGYNSKNIKVVVKIFTVEVDRTFLKVHAKYLVKITRIGDVMGRMRPTYFKEAFL